jgi:hypothetical protein
MLHDRSSNALSVQADCDVFLEHALKLLLWLPSYATRARVDASVTHLDRATVQAANDHARLTVHPAVQSAA